MKKSELKLRIKELEDELFEARVEAATYKRLYEQSSAPQWPTTSPATPVWQPDITYTDKTWAPPFADWCKTTSMQQKADELDAWARAVWRDLREYAKRSPVGWNELDEKGKA